MNCKHKIFLINLEKTIEKETNVWYDIKNKIYL